MAIYSGNKKQKQHANELMWFTFSYILTLLIVGKWIIESKQFKSIIMKFLQKQIDWVKKYKHDLAIVAGVAAIGLLVPMGKHWSEVAKRIFWENFWEWTCYVCLVVWVAGWVWAKNRDKSLGRD